MYMHMYGNDTRSLNEISANYVTLHTCELCQCSRSIVCRSAAASAAGRCGNRRCFCPRSEVVPTEEVTTDLWLSLVDSRKLSVPGGIRRCSLCNSSWQPQMGVACLSLSSVAQLL